MWTDLIKCKYGEDRFWCSNISTDAYGVGFWRAIRNLWAKLEVNLHIKVGDGRRTRFWRDVWIKQTPLKKLFPDLFILCTNSEAMMSVFGVNSMQWAVVSEHLEECFLSELYAMGGSMIQESIWN